MSIKSALGVAVILGLTCAQLQAGPKRWGDRTSGRDLDLFRYDIREAERLHRYEEAQSRDDGDPKKGWAYDVLFIRRSLGGTYGSVYPTRYGMFPSKGECEQARDDRIAFMDNDSNDNPRDPNGPVKFPVQAWYSETSKSTQHSQTQASGEAKGEIQISINGTSGKVSGAGGVESTTQSELRRGGDQRAMLFKHCVSYPDRQMQPIPNIKGPGRPGGLGTGRRAESQQ